ncbi:MAG: hypothetical protein HFI73_07105 [Bacilli bacterium]|mgnify:FL=1|jgi:hypothetical protein|nr:hypothetical protein [Bacilli bacterium]
MKKELKFNENYISRTEDLVTLNLVRHLVFISKDEITISSLYDDFVDVTLNRIEMLKIAKFIREDYPNRSTLSLDNITFKINPNWMIISRGKNLVTIRPEMFCKIVDYIEEHEQPQMNESNTTQDIYNFIINSTNNPTGAGEVIKPISVEQQPKKIQSIYDTIIDTMKQETKGENENGK